MKKVIKFLFPKTYKAIYDEGYNQCWGDYNSEDDYPEYDDHYEHYVEDDYQYPDNYWDEDGEHEHEETYADFYNRTNDILIEEWEELCREEEKALAEIYLPKAPELEVGDKIHLHSKMGMYTVVEVYTNSFAYKTRYSDVSYANYKDYKCHAGGKWNYKGE